MPFVIESEYNWPIIYFRLLMSSVISSPSPHPFLLFPAFLLRLIFCSFCFHCYLHSSPQQLPINSKFGTLDGLSRSHRQSSFSSLNSVEYVVSYAFTHVRLCLFFPMKQMRSTAFLHSLRLWGSSFSVSLLSHPCFFSVVTVSHSWLC